MIQLAGVTGRLAGVEEEEEVYFDSTHCSIITLKSMKRPSLGPEIATCVIRELYTLRVIHL